MISHLYAWSGISLLSTEEAQGRAGAARIPVGLRPQRFYCGCHLRLVRDDRPVVDDLPGGRHFLIMFPRWALEEVARHLGDKEVEIKAQHAIGAWAQAHMGLRHRELLFPADPAAMAGRDPQATFLHAQSRRAVLDRSDDSRYIWHPGRLLTLDAAADDLTRRLAHVPAAQGQALECSVVYRPAPYDDILVRLDAWDRPWCLPSH